MTACSCQPRHSAFPDMDAMVDLMACHFPGHSCGNCTAVLWSHAYFTADDLAFKGREADWIFGVQAEDAPAKLCREAGEGHIQIPA